MSVRGKSNISYWILNSMHIAYNLKNEVLFEHYLFSQYKRFMNACTLKKDNGKAFYLIQRILATLEFTSLFYNTYYSEYYRYTKYARFFFVCVWPLFADFENKSL